jgi:carbohydrate-binding DOMON domain-containing protein
MWMATVCATGSTCARVTTTQTQTVTVSVTETVTVTEEPGPIQAPPQATVAETGHDRKMLLVGAGLLAFMLLLLVAARR